MGFSIDLLKDKSIVITGGGSGLGLSMCKTFLAHGAKVLICSRNLEKLEKVVSELDKEFKGMIFCVACDVRDPEQVENMRKQAEELLGGTNVLVNNAAGNFISPTERLSPNAFKSIVDIVLYGTANCTMSFGKHWLKEKREALILNITTTYASTGSGYVVPSAAAKAAVLNMTRSLAVEWGNRKIRSIAIAPGPFPTPGAWQRLFPEAIESLFDPKDRIPLGRFGDHSELQNLANFLVSDLASYINGEVITIDGGEWLQGAGEMNTLGKLSEEYWDQVQEATRKAK